jgi:large subunit ribosomal protein L6
MEKQLTVPDGVDVEIDGKAVKVSGEKGTLERKFKHFHDIKIDKKDGEIVVSSKSEKRNVKSMVGTIRAHIQNMVAGVSEGHVKKMKVIYSHFPVTIKIEGENVIISNFLGEKLPRVAKIKGDVTVDVNGQDITVSGLDKEDIGQTCSNIEQACRITKFDRRVFQDGIYPVKE